MSSIFRWMGVSLCIVILSCKLGVLPKKISLQSSHENLQGVVTSLETEEAFTRIVLDTGFIDISPTLSQWPNRFEIQIGDRVLFSTMMTIGDKSSSLTVQNKDEDPRLRIVQGAFGLVSLPDTPKDKNKEAGVRYSVYSARLNSDSSLSLLRVDGKKEVVATLGEEVVLDGWTLYLVRMEQIGSGLSEDSGFAQESASLNYDYILYREGE